MPSYTPPDQIFHEELRYIDQGMALWHADPFDEYEVVKLGDIGFYKQGKYYPRGNRWSGEQEPKSLTKRINASSPWTSESVTNRKVEAGAGTQQAVASAELGGSYQCHSQRGALLALKDGYAIAYDLDNAPLAELQTWLTANYEEARIQSTCAKIDDVVVITGVTLTGDWDAAVWSTGVKSGHVGLAGGVPNMVLAKTSVAVAKTTTQGLVQSSGHSHQLDPRRSGSSSNLSTNSSSTDLCKAKDCIGNVTNQCVFIRAFRLKKRLFHQGVKVMKAMAEEKDPDLGDDKDENASTAVVATDVQNDELSTTPSGEMSVLVEDFPEKPEVTSVYDEIFEYIFENSEAEVAIVHDRDVPRWLDTKNQQGTLDLPIITNPIHKAAYLRSVQSKALIVSVRYRGQKFREKNIEINKDHSEALRFRELLINNYNYNESDIVMLLEGEKTKEPNKANIVQEMNALVSFASSGDRFAFYFSGHASQEFISKDDDGQDGQIETIWPMDYATADQTLLERDLHDCLVSTIKEVKCKLTAIFDVSHGETILDLSGTIPFTQKNVRNLSTFGATQPQGEWQNPADYGVDVNAVEHLDSSAFLEESIEQEAEEEITMPPQTPAGVDEEAEDEQITPVAENHGEGPPIPTTATAGEEMAIPPVIDVEDPAGGVVEVVDAEGDDNAHDAVIGGDYLGEGSDDEAKGRDQVGTDDQPFGIYGPERPNKFQVVRGKIGLREHYIVTSSSHWQSEEPAASTSAAAQTDIMDPDIIWFSRRAVLRVSAAEDFGDIVEPPYGFPSEEDQGNIPELIGRTEVVKVQLMTLADQSASAAKMILEFLGEDLDAASNVGNNSGPSPMMHAGVVFLGELLCQRPWLLQDSRSDSLRTKRQILLLVILDIGAFYAKCERVTQEFIRGQISADRKRQEDEKNNTRCQTFTGQLRNIYNDLLAIKPSDLRDDPANNPLLRDEGSYLPTGNLPGQATITSWTVCRSVEEYWTGPRASGIDTCLFDILADDPHPTYRSLLLGATQQLETTTTRTGGVLTDRAQLSTMSQLDLNMEFAF